MPHAKLLPIAANHFDKPAYQKIPQGGNKTKETGRTLKSLLEDAVASVLKERFFTVELVQTFLE